jgi:hypothetical protein
MTNSRLLAALLLAAPGFARAAPHSIVVRMTKGGRAYAHTSAVEAGASSNYAGTIDGRKVINNLALKEAGDAVTIDYQLESTDPGEGGTLQITSTVRLKPGYGVRAVEYDGWKVDIALDAPMGKDAIPSSAPSGVNLRLTTVLGKRTCKIVSEGGSQTNLVDGSMKNGRKQAFILNTVTAAPVGGASTIQYQLEDAGAQTQGEEKVVVGRKKAAKGGKASFLLEGAAR